MSAQEDAIESRTSQARPLTETVEVQLGTSRVSCDGGGGASGHPVVWLTMTTQSSGGALAAWLSKVPIPKEQIYAIEEFMNIAVPFRAEMTGGLE